MKTSELVMLQHIDDVLGNYTKILKQADDVLNAYIDTLRSNSDEYDHMREAQETGISAIRYDLKYVYFEDYRGYFAGENTVVMPLEFVYSPTFRETKLAECNAELAKQADLAAAKKAEEESPMYAIKLAQFNQLKKELGK